MSASVQKYLDLIPSANADKEKFLATITALVQGFADEAATLSGIPELYDLDTAVGSQLDVCGQWIGLSRQLTKPIEGVYFSFDTVGVGFNQGVWKGPFDPTEGVVSLDDETYRTLLYIKIAANHWNGTAEQAQAILSQIFINSTGTHLFIQDNFDMTMLVGLAGTLPSALLISLLREGYLSLRPSAVGMKVVETSIDGSPIFGFDVNNSFIGGFNSGTWGVTALI